MFVRVAPRTFKYMLLMPDEPGHAIANTILDDLWTGRADRMRRVCVTMQELEQYWPDVPIRVERG